MTAPLSPDARRSDDSPRVPAAHGGDGDRAFPSFSFHIASRYSKLYRLCRSHPGVRIRGLSFLLGRIRHDQVFTANGVRGVDQGMTRP